MPCGSNGMELQAAGYQRRKRPYYPPSRSGKTESRDSGGGGHSSISSAWLGAVRAAGASGLENRISRYGGPVLTPSAEYARSLQDAASRFAQSMRRFEQQEGRSLDDYLRGIGRTPAQVEGYGVMPMKGGALAATIQYGDRAVIVGNADRFEDRVERFASRYLAGVEPGKAYDLALRYVLAHEKAHTYQRGADDPRMAERDNERTLCGYFLSKADAAYAGNNLGQAQEYLQLAGIAAQRYGEVDGNYGGAGDSDYGNEFAGGAYGIGGFDGPFDAGGSYS
jgi:hypothetical protein